MPWADLRLKLNLNLKNLLGQKNVNNKKVKRIAAIIGGIKSASAPVIAAMCPNISKGLNCSFT